jgi:general secretion pathway protein D
METAISGGKYNQMRNRQLEQKAQDLPLMSKEEIPVLPNLKDFIIILPGEAVSLPPKIKAQPLK